MKQFSRSDLLAYPFKTGQRILVDAQSIQQELQEKDAMEESLAGLTERCMRLSEQLDQLTLCDIKPSIALHNEPIHYFEVRNG